MNAALYIHIPFCEKKCAYCDFYSVTKNSEILEQFVRALQTEIELYADSPMVNQYLFQTIYLGGGTPSVLPITSLEILVDSIFKHFDFVPTIEATIEINPETVTLQKLTEINSLGINRLSIGVQSFHDKELNVLDRIHNSVTAQNSITWAQQAGFSNINIDLIFGIPGQSLKTWKENLTKAISFSPQQISMYGLTIEPHTPMAQWMQQGRLKPISEFMERKMYQTGIFLLEANGYNQYEISNFARAGRSAIHNQMYWDGNPYLGLGPSAHSFWDDTRQWNVADVNDYIQTLNGRQLPIEDVEQLTNDQQLLEFIMLNLRKKAGIDLSSFKERFGCDFLLKYEDEIRHLKTAGTHQLYELTDTHFRLTTEGFLLYNEVCSRLTN